MKLRFKIAGAGVFALAASMATAAQAADSAASAQESASGAQTEEVDSGGIADIVVTAQRRAQKIQAVPISISALTSDSVEASGISGTVTLQSTVPGLSIQRQANGALPFLRGIGSTIGDANAESSVAIYVDGVYQPSSFTNFFDFNDIERIEVLKGPQGTLFGRNATGGVIQVVTKDPSDHLEGRFQVGYANYDTVTANAYVSMPISSAIAFNASIQYENRQDGWGRNLTLNKDTPGARNFVARGKLRIEPDEVTSIILSGNYSRSENGALTAQRPNVPNVTPSTPFGPIPYAGNYNVYEDFEDGSDIQSYGGSLHIDRDFGGFKFVSITAYQKASGPWKQDFDLTGVPLFQFTLHEKSKMFSQEVHILSPGDSTLQWLIGGYYYYRNAGFLPTAGRGLAFTGAGPNNGIDLFGNSVSRSKALFAQATYPILTDTNLTAGFRYSWESAAGTAYSALGGTNIIVDPFGGPPFQNRLSYSKPTWRVSLDHKFSADVLGYASYNRGMKSGNFGVSGGPAGMANPYLPEQIDAYEVGLKTEWFDHKLRVNAAAFYYNFKNYQFQRLVQGSAFIFNGPSATVYGGELEIEARPVANLTLTANLGLLHTEIGDFPNAPNSCLDPTGVSYDYDPAGLGSPSVACAPGTWLPTTTLFNAKGNPLPSAPKVTGNFSFAYDIPTKSGTFTLSSNVYYTDSASAEIGNRLRYGSRTMLSASIGWTDPNEQLKIRVWGRNLTNKYYYNQLSVAPGLSDIGSPAEPRAYGITLGYSFP